MTLIFLNHSYLDNFRLLIQFLFGTQKGKDFLKVKMLVTQWCSTLYDPMDYSPWESSVHGILQARMQEWVAVPFSRGSSRPSEWTLVSCTEGKFFTIWATKKWTVSTSYLLYRKPAEVWLIKEKGEKFYKIIKRKPWFSDKFRPCTQSISIIKSMSLN